jgi:hypothetical protein
MPTSIANAIVILTASPRGKAIAELAKRGEWPGPERQNERCLASDYYAPGEFAEHESHGIVLYGRDSGGLYRCKVPDELVKQVVREAQEDNLLAYKNVIILHQIALLSPDDEAAHVRLETADNEFRKRLIAVGFFPSE